MNKTEFGTMHTIRLHTGIWGTVRYQYASVYLAGWGLLYRTSHIGTREAAREVYQRAHRALRAYRNYGDVSYSGRK